MTTAVPFSLPNVSSDLSNFTGLGVFFAFLIAILVVGLVAFIMLLVLSIKHGLMNEKNPKLQALFWLTVGAFVLAFIPYVRYLSIPAGIAQFVLLCMCAFGKDRYKMATTVFILDMVNVVLAIVMMVVLVASFGSSLSSISG